MSDNAKGRELGLQSLQKLQSKSVGAESIPLVDVYHSAINALYKFSMKCHELLKPEVAEGFKSLCRESQPITTWLFGDELPKSIRDIAQVKRMCVKKFSNKWKFEGPSTSTGKRFNDSTASVTHSVSSQPQVSGGLRLFVKNWARITSDPWVLETISQGYKIEFCRLPVQSTHYKIKQKCFSRKSISDEVAMLLAKGAIRQCSANKSQYISNLFFVPKKSGEM